MNKYLCVDNLVIDNVVLCTAGRWYEIVDAKPNDNETEEDVAGYCDILDCDNGNVCNATWIDVGECFEM